MYRSDPRFLSKLDRYVGSEAAEDHGEPFQKKMRRLAAQWRE